MKQRVGPGAMLDIPTPDEIVRALPRPEQISRVRETSQKQLDSSGGGVVECYECPAGYEFALRRITIYLGNPPDGVTGAVALNVAGHAVLYQRSGTFIELGQPMYGSVIQVPGVQTWGDQQGPYFRNKERFEVAAVGLTAGGFLTVVTEGLLCRPAVSPGGPA